MKYFNIPLNFPQLFVSMLTFLVRILPHYRCSTCQCLTLLSFLHYHQAVLKQDLYHGHTESLGLEIDVASHPAQMLGFAGTFQSFSCTLQEQLKHTLWLQFRSDLRGSIPYSLRQGHRDWTEEAHRTSYKEGWTWNPVRDIVLGLI